MSEIDIYIGKINNATFHSSDVPLLMKVLQQDSKSGKIELTRNDVRLFQIYTFALQQLELTSGTASPMVHAGDWRDIVDDLSMLKQVMDDMERENVTGNVAWNAGGMAIFDIPDEGRYRKYIHSMIRLHLNRLYEKYM